MVLGAAQGVYQLGWVLGIWKMTVAFPPIATAYLIGSAVSFAAAGVGIYLLRCESPNPEVLRGALLACLGAALIGEGLYMSVWYASRGILEEPRQVIHCMRNLTLDVWLLFAAWLLSVSPASAYTRRLLLAMIWWLGTVFLFYWWDRSPPLAPYLLALTWLATAFAVGVGLRRGAPSGASLLLAGGCWALLLVYLVYWALSPSLALGPAIAGPALMQLQGPFVTLIGALNDWFYNSTPFWLLFIANWQTVHEALVSTLLRTRTARSVARHPLQRHSDRHPRAE